ncbi:S24/S26 family peptidase [Phosphitispora sp. TUW77]|uniref:S24/S26 family peptidase n=1 Tax=Phosphitispora sp. TUW77 TaxID=3152361 RepID=UPI003AB2C77A
MPANNLSQGYISADQWSSAIMPILAEGHTLRLPFEGLSMHPLLVGGRDEVIIAAASEKQLKRGDIVLYKRNDGTHVLHRIHHIKNSMYYMVGDAQTWIEGPIREEQVLAFVTEIIRKGKTIPCSDCGYRLISGLWLLARPLRPQIIKNLSHLRFFLKPLVLLLERGKS